MNDNELKIELFNYCNLAKSQRQKHLRLGKTQRRLLQTTTRSLYQNWLRYFVACVFVSVSIITSLQCNVVVTSCMQEVERIAEDAVRWVQVQLEQLNLI